MFLNSSLHFISEHGIDEDCFFFLGEEHEMLKEVIPTIGLRLKFKKNLKTIENPVHVDGLVSLAVGH
jgi:hypothetical protein